jgi:drug/metabolite transporter (DMT)-like permease
MTSRLIGYSAAAATVAIGVAWQLATRAGVTTTLAPIDLALFRYVIPAIVFAPFWLKSGPLPRSVHPGLLALMVLGAGLPFGLLGIAGAQYAPVAHMGALIPGTMPLFVAILSAIVLKEIFAPSRLLGFALIIVGILAIGGHVVFHGEAGVWRGDLLFLSASMIWAVYTIAYRKSGLSPAHSSAIVSFWSALLVIPAWYFSGAGKALEAPVADVLLQVVAQGFVAGVCGFGAFALAVKHIGPTPTATAGALVPVCVAAGGWLFLSEPIDLLTAIGIAATTLGVIFATGAVAFKALKPVR